MNFTTLSAPAFWLGALAIAGVLFALQRLRVRHREVLVVTTMFWRDALEEARARTLVERFRHPLVYALLLALASIAWVSVAGPRADRGDGAEHLFLLDLSAPMAAGELFDDSLRALTAEVARAERDERRVVACGERLETLLAPGEDELLLDQRLALVAPGTGAPSVERALLLFGVSHEGRPPVVAHVVGVAHVRDEVVQRLGGTRVERIRPRDAAAPVASPAITAVTSARSALVRGRVDVWVDVADVIGTLRLDAALVRAGVREPLTPTRVEPVAGGARAVFESVVADGAVFEARLPDTAALDTARSGLLVLPDLAPLRVALGAGLPEALALVLASHPDVELTDAGAEVAVCVVGDPLASALPAFEIGAPLTEPAIELVHTGAADARGLLFRALGDLGLDMLDLGAVAQRAERPVEFVESTAARRGLVVWRELFASDSAFVASAEFPVFVARVLEWLAGRPQSRFAPRVGEALDGVAATYREVGGEIGAEQGAARVLDPIGGSFTPPRSGVFERVDDLPGEAFAPAPQLVSAGPIAPLGDADSAVVRVARTAPTAAFDLANFVLLVLAALFVVEWWLVRAERIA